MTDRSLGELDFAKYQSLFLRAAGETAHVFVCCPEGELLWSSDGASDGFVASILSKLNEGNFRWQTNRLGVTRREIDAHTSVLLCRMDHAQGDCLGWLAAAVNGGPPSATERKPHPLAPLLESVAHCVETEHRLTVELDQSAAELARRYEELNLAYGMVGHLRNYENLESFLDHLLSTCMDHLAIEAAAVVAPLESPGRTFVSSSGRIPNLDLALSEVRGGLFHYIAASPATVVINGQEDPRRQYLLPALTYKVIAAPIFSDRAVTSLLLAIRNDNDPDFSNSDRSLIELIADQASIVTRAHNMLLEMRQFTNQIAGALISTVEAKDPYTRGHSERVSKIAMKIGDAMGFGESELEQLFWGALLHDIGKIGIPDQILRKPQSLSEDEYNFVKVHPERSYDILRHIGYVGRGVQAARYHQERYDGAGYPHGLAGRGIPVFARIIAVADTFDAITSSRSYRPGRDLETALAEIERVAGSQLDPEIVKTFLALCNDEPEWLRELSNEEDDSVG